MKILVMLTSHDHLGATGRKTGFWLEELAAPYYVFMGRWRQDDTRFAKGGSTLDPKSDDPDSQTEATRRVKTLIHTRAGSPAVMVSLATSQN